MSDHPQGLESLLHDLRERAKELNCLYEVQELLSRPGTPLDEIFEGVIRVIPPAWQYPDICQAEILYGEQTYRSAGFRESPWRQSAEIAVQDEIVGRVNVFYAAERPASDEGPFLKEERKLIDAIAEQLGFYLLHEQLRHVFQERAVEGVKKSEWAVLLQLLKRTNPELLLRISRKMVTFLSWSGIKEAERLLESYSLAYPGDSALNGNRPVRGPTPDRLLAMSDEVLDVASRNLSRETILDNIQRWSREDRTRFLVNVLASPNSTLAEVAGAIERYQLLATQGLELVPSRDRWLRTTLVRRLLGEDPQFLNVAHDYLTIDDLAQLLRRVIHPLDGSGSVGGKGAGLILAGRILGKFDEAGRAPPAVRIPKTWFLTSDAITRFISYNGLEDTVEQKYREIHEVRQEYPYQIHVFKNSPFPPELAKGLSLALDDFKDVPLIVRSSSLLEDQAGVTFAGKYKSLFIANRGTRQERLAELTDAIAEVFASQFAPDPIEYRAQHGLLDHHEAMGILIQEVVGQPVGRYYLPAFAGVALSQNEFRWSGRIRRDDGLVRMVPGLGTRAVDRLSDDYPVLVAPGQPRLRVNVTPDEVLRYSPKKIDVINLERGAFETVDVRDLLNELGRSFPLREQLVSLLDSDHLVTPGPGDRLTDGRNAVITFEGLFTRTPFLEQMRTILAVLQEALGHPVDIEFAHDGQDFYLLQCRRHRLAPEDQPATIPPHLAPERVVFSANRYVGNGFLAGISRIVYVDPEAYAALETPAAMASVGRAVSGLNQILPRRGFLLMGPGRWGSRGDIRLGVSVTYADINNTAMLIEIAGGTTGYDPEPSFGTHFFQDLVEGSIPYLPLYPGAPGVVFNKAFLTSAANLLPVLLPEFAQLADVVRVIDVPAAAGGRFLEVRMNADAEQGVAILADPPPPPEGA